MLAVNARIGMWLGESFAIDMLEPRQLVRNTVFSLVMFTVALFTGQMRNLIGGRAHQRPPGALLPAKARGAAVHLAPREGLSPLSVRLGNEQFHELLSAVFFDVDAPIIELGGEIYEYAGDAVIASWYLGKGNQEQHVIEAAFAACDAVHRRSEWYRHKFGEVPGLRAVLPRGVGGRG